MEVFGPTLRVGPIIWSDFPGAGGGGVARSGGAGGWGFRLRQRWDHASSGSGVIIKIKEEAGGLALPASFVFLYDSQA